MNLIVKTESLMRTVKEKNGQRVETGKQVRENTKELNVFDVTVRKIYAVA